MNPTTHRPKTRNRPPLLTPSLPLYLGLTFFIVIIVLGTAFLIYPADDGVQPTEIIQPEARQACTVELDSTGTDQHPNQATVTCGAQQTTLAGDFRERTTNRYNPDDADGITSLIVVGDERRVYMADDEDQTCAIIWSEGQTPTDCEPTTIQEHTAS